jgi:CRISPR-associated protein Csb1
MANHFEALGWDGPQQQPVALLADLPYVEVTDPGGSFLTSSRREAHRLAAAYVRNGTIDGQSGAEWLAGQLGTTPGKPLDWCGIYRAIYALDPLCLVHGVFFSDRRWHGTPRIQRALTAVIEAHDVSPVISGGLKRDDVQIKSSEGMRADDGYGFIPFGRTEYVAGEIVLTAVLDLEQIRGYGLDARATELLTLVALWELSALLAGSLRLRTACDLEVQEIAVRKPARGFRLPAPRQLAAAIAKLTPRAFERRGAQRVVWEPKQQKKAA